MLRRFPGMHLLLAALLLPALTPCLASLPSSPPYKRGWIALGSDRQRRGVYGDTYYRLVGAGSILGYSSYGAYGALDTRTGKVLWETALPNRTETGGGRVATDGHLFGEGAGFIRFYAPEHDLSGKPVPDSAAQSVILWNRDHTEAKVGISLYFASLSGGGTEVRLKKIDGRWFVVDVEAAYIS